MVINSVVLYWFFVCVVSGFLGFGFACVLWFMVSSCFCLFMLFVLLCCGLAWFALPGVWYFVDYSVGLYCLFAVAVALLWLVADVGL